MFFCRDFSLVNLPNTFIRPLNSNWFVVFRKVSSPESLTLHTHSLVPLPPSAPSPEDIGFSAVLCHSGKREQEAAFARHFFPCHYLLVTLKTCPIVKTVPIERGWLILISFPNMGFDFLFSKTGYTVRNAGYSPLYDLTCDELWQLGQL